MGICFYLHFCTSWEIVTKIVSKPQSFWDTALYIPHTRSKYGAHFILTCVTDRYDRYSLAVSLYPFISLYLAHSLIGCHLFTLSSVSYYTLT